MTPGQDRVELLWREMSPAEREREYSPSSAIGGDFSRYIEDYVLHSEAARQQCSEAGIPIAEIRYGPGRSETVDLVVPPEADSAVPLLVFIHGGYWQLLSKRDSFFSAVHSLDQGIAFAAIDYTLAPSASLDEIVQECRQALRDLGERASDHGYSRDRIFIAGSSAGAHLAAMMGLAGRDRSENGLGFAPAGLVLISGVFDLEPLIGTTINDAVGLDLAAAIRNSPLLGTLDGLPPTLLSWGEIETDEFKRHSKLMADRLERSGVKTAVLEVPGCNHFDIVLGLADNQALLGEAVVNFVANPRSLANPPEGAT